MKTKRLFVCICTTGILFGAALAQSPKASLLETLPAVTQGKKLELGHLMDRNLYPGAPSQLQWMERKDGMPIYVFLRNDTAFYHVVETNTEKPMITLDKLNEDVKKAGGKHKLEHFPLIRRVTDNCLYLRNRNHVFVFYSDKTETEIYCSLDRKGTNFDLSTASGLTAFTRDNNLFVLRDGMRYSITKDLDTGIVNGQSVHRDEFGITKGTFWSNDGTRLAYYRMDESMVTKYPIHHYDSMWVETIRYPHAGEKMHKVSVNVFNTETFKTVELEPFADPSHTYITSVVWSPDDRDLYLGILDRNQKDFSLVRYDAQTGKVKGVVFTEHSDVYVEPESGIVFRPGHPDQFVWLSERNGFNHAYLYNTSGKLLKKVTPDNEAWMISSLVGFSPDGKTLYFMGTKDGALQQNLYAVEVEKGKVRRVTKEDGMHSVKMDGTGSYFIDYYSAPALSRRIQVIDNKGNVVKVIADYGDMLADYVRPEFRLYTLTAADGRTPLYGRMILPPDFDSTRKYPVIVYVYGGPHAQLINKGYNYACGTFLRFLAQQGYVVWTVDSRGSANRGFAFETAIHRNIGVAEAADQMQGIAFLKSLPFVDSSRIGVDGWSYGGFMALNLKTRFPDVFKVTTSGGPVINWAWYEVMYGERYMGTPQDNPEGYRAANLLERVDSVRGKVMLIQGGLDPTVLPKNSTTFVKRCIDRKIPVDFFVYPDHEHNVRGAERDHLFEKLYEYYKQNL